MTLNELAAKVICLAIAHESKLPEACVVRVKDAWCSFDFVLSTKRSHVLARGVSSRARRLSAGGDAPAAQSGKGVNLFF